MTVYARLVFDRFDRPEVIVYEGGGEGNRYEVPILAIPLEKLKEWVKELSQHERESRVSRVEKFKRKKRK